MPDFQKPEDKISITFDQCKTVNTWHFRIDCPWHSEKGGPYLTRTAALIAAAHVLGKSTAFH